MRTLESLLEQGVPCDLDCPTCEEKMVEINVYYEPDMTKAYGRLWWRRARFGLKSGNHAGDWHTSNRVRVIQAQLRRSG